MVGDLRDSVLCRDAVDQPFDDVYQLAADMGGSGFVFSGDNDADIMHNSALINLNMVEACQRRNAKKIFIPPLLVCIPSIIKKILIIPKPMKVLIPGCAG